MQIIYRIVTHNDNKDYMKYAKNGHAVSPYATNMTKFFFFFKRMDKKFQIKLQIIKYRKDR